MGKPRRKIVERKKYNKIQARIFTAAEHDGGSIYGWAITTPTGQTVCRSYGGFDTIRKAENDLMKTAEIMSDAQPPEIIINGGGES